MADPEIAKPIGIAGEIEDDRTLLAIEASEPVVLQEPDRISDMADPTAVMPVKKPEKRQSGLLAFVVGGALLAGAGFGVAKYVFPDTTTANALTALQTQFDVQQAEATALKASLAALSARPGPDTGLGDRIAALEGVATDVPAAIARLTSLEDRLTAIEAASASGQGAPTAALVTMSQQIKALQTQMDAQKAGAPTLVAGMAAAQAAAQAKLDAAEQSAEAAAKQAALSHIRAAFESGAPLGPALDSLKAMGADIPATLAAATDGMPTLLALQDGFAGAARTALDASVRADMGEGWADRLTSFLRNQSGARSLTPQEGTDPDAVLSRAEAALQSGQVKEALSELAGLPPEGIEAMAPWVADATRRIDTEQAISDLSATLNKQ